MKREEAIKSLAEKAWESIDSDSLCAWFIEQQEKYFGEFSNEQLETEFKEYYDEDVSIDDTENLTHSEE